MPISNPGNNKWKQRYNELCGTSGKPPRSHVVELLCEAGRWFNEDVLETEVQATFEEFNSSNPWHLSFVVGVAWGQYAKKKTSFYEPALKWLSGRDENALSQAKTENKRSEADALGQCLRSGFRIFETMNLPDTIPTSLDELQQLQLKWIDRVPKLGLPQIGDWNFSALFMVMLFDESSRWKQLMDTTILLPLGGPVGNFLHTLVADDVIDEGPWSKRAVEEKIDPGKLFLCQKVMEDLLGGREDRSLVDIHSGLYVMGAKD